MSEFRVIYHQQLCPDCGSDNITENDIQTTDGYVETALICGDCGAAWPVACVAEQLESAARPHLALRIDAYPPDAEPARRRYWCPSCDGYLTGAELAASRVLHYIPGPERIITAGDLRPVTTPEATR
jgi:hypothetical protein